MEVKTTGRAGGLESGDALVTVEANPRGGVRIELDSVLKAQFGNSIIDTARRAAERMGAGDVLIHIVDRGALDHVILARVQAALYRAGGAGEFDWSKGWEG